jgi:hypothetical protein
MVELALIAIFGIYLQIVLVRDKKYRKEMKKKITEYNKNVKAQEKRQQREEKLRTMRVPGVLYLNDFRAARQTQRII